MTAVCHLLVGPPQHGVVRCAQAVHDALVALGVDHTSVHVEFPMSRVPVAVSDADRVHLHVTDRLFGRNPAEASDNLRALVTRTTRPVSVTLHDIPQPSDGPAMTRRVEFYRAALAVADAVVVSSEHEAELIATHVDAGVTVEVIPLMVADPHPIERPQRHSAVTVGVLGFLYPGKGHIETLDAMRDLPSDVGFVALGMPSPGHEDLADELRALAERQGRSCEITGFISDDELGGRLADITVPVAYHRHLSASGSIATWIEAGRKPLVPTGRYVDELARRSPGTVTVHGDDSHALRLAIAVALTDRESTWIDPTVTPVPSPRQVAEAYAGMFVGSLT